MAIEQMQRPQAATDVAKYPAIGDHGLIGDLQTAALVTTDGVIDWFCAKRFDGPSVFASILDAERGGHFRIGSATPSATKQLYFPASAVLVTRFMTDEGVGEVIDFMPIDEPKRAKEDHRIVRAIRTVRGTMRFALHCAPRFDYGRADHKLEVTDEGAVFSTPDMSITLHTPIKLQRYGRDVRAEITLREGQSAGVILDSGPRTPPRSFAPEEFLAMAQSTIDDWQRWVNHSTYTGRWRENVQRSAIALRLMTYAPTGALIAAPTAGLPEQVGGERNWDYRFTWVRDASFTIFAMLGLGYEDEAAAFLHWLNDRVIDEAGRDSGPLKIMYRVDGSSDLTEEILPHLEGYRGSRPVRIGNGAADQLQLDIYGEAMNSVYEAHRRGLRIGHPGWMHLRQIADWLLANWDRPDEGIWETRGGRQDFTYGRFMSWVALDRIIRMARDLGLPADVDRLSINRDQIYDQLHQRAWNPQKQAFVQHYDTDVLDASVLLMPTVGFVSPTDPMWQSTLRAIDHELVSDSLVYRYDPKASPDGLQGHEGTFSICTFWYVDALTRSGRVDDARLVFDKMMTYANHLGLFSEEIGLTGEQLGNFPQAFSHLSLINAAVNLNATLDRRPPPSNGNGGQRFV
jgi:GH15 family glucan-1,4-alpha-glucosidase